MLPDQARESHSPPERGRQTRDRPVVFIGFMGAGKTKVGRLVAERIGRTFVDIDDLIEQRAARSITDIFAHDGEAAFRRMEMQAIAEALSGEPEVIALGGGAATREENWQLLREADALTVYLRAKPETILERVADHTHRPLLAGLDREGMLGKITGMLDEREPWYLRAELVISSDNSTDKYGMADTVIERLKAAGFSWQ